MAKKTLIIIVVILILLAGLFSYNHFINDSNELRTVKSEKELLKIYEGEDSSFKDFLIKILSTPFSLPFEINSRGTIHSAVNDDYSNRKGSVDIDTTISGISPESATNSTSKKDYSTTNIQVENVDEADITKTDGNYIYSLSDNNVIITDAKNPQTLEIVSKINGGESIPEDLILYKNKLVVISYKGSSYSSNTLVDIYDLTDISNPYLLKNYELEQPYYTSRCINNELFIISSGNLKKGTNKIKRTYIEDAQEKEIDLNNIKYLKDVKSTKQTLIASLDLDNAKENIDVSSYLIDISNCYVSEQAIYLLNQKYNYSSDYDIQIKNLFGIKGVFGLFDDNDLTNDDYGYHTQIFKFSISKNGQISYSAKTKVKGKTINQYSLDEKNNHLRVALYDNSGTRIEIFDENLKQIGISNTLAKGETMYSSRFIGDKAYLVTYKTIDPLFVIDLSNEASPKVLGQLKIPGYSTYLHPYDENHLIGIGMQTEEITNRNSLGKVTSTTARITGMKMALFDVSDINMPKQISETIIGDSRTTSAILTNPKALLFSKEKELIAIPVNNYDKDFEVTSSDSYSSTINFYKNNSMEYIAEGYLVYKLNLTEGFKLKGSITHEKDQTKDKYSYYYNTSKMLRGLYIDNNLFTVSETAIKVNNLDTLDLISELKIEK